MDAPAQRPIRSGAKTRSGAPCAKYPITGKRRCRLHGGAATGPITAAGRERIAAANTKHGRFVGWRENQERKRFYRGEVKRVMREAREAGYLENK